MANGWPARKIQRHYTLDHNPNIPEEQWLEGRDGNWVNPADRWYEGNPSFATAHSVLALQTALE